MIYLCLLDGILEYSTNSLSDFNHYRMMYAEDHRGTAVKYMAVTEEAYLAMYPDEESD